MKRFLTVPIAVGFLIALAPLSVCAEQIRGQVTVAAAPAAVTDSYRAEISMEQITILPLTGDPRFLDGLRLEIQVPAAARMNPGALGFYLYSSVSPEPEDRVMTLTGHRLLFLPMPNAARFFVTIPLSEPHAFRATADTHVTPAVAPEAFPLAVALVPITKGITQATARSQFSLQIEPIVPDIGAVKLIVRTPDGEVVDPEAAERREFTLHLNGDTIEYEHGELVLRSGLYRIGLESEKYEHEQLTFGVERGRVAQVAFTLREPQSVIRFEAPEGAELFVNGESVAHDNGEFTLPPGEHTVLFRVGDYAVSRRLLVEPRKSYQISLGLDILIEEN